MSLISDLFGGGAEEAANAQVESAERATEEQRRQFDITQRNLLPFRSVSAPGVNALASMLGITPDTSSIDAQIAALEDQLARASRPTQAAQSAPRGPVDTGLLYREAGPSGNGSFSAESGFPVPVQQAFNQANGADTSAIEQQLATLRGQRDALTQGYDFQTSPGYEFRLNEGQDAVQNRLAAMGGRLGGRGLKELVRYGQDYASNEFGQQFNRLAGLTGVGQSATSQANQAGMAGTNAISDLITQQGNALAAGQMGQGNAIRGLIGTGLGASIGLGWRPFS